VSNKIVITMSYAKCSIFVSGLDMKCPLCQAIVRSGESHECQRPQKPIKTIPKTTDLGRVKS
jgi:hypothetical protein